MAREVDIWWENAGRLKASMRWTNKRGRISFTLIPSAGPFCGECPFCGNPICGKWRKGYNTGHLCGELWVMKGDNLFEKRDKIIGWQILGPVGREKKKDKH
jgi:hypothetical protein